MRRLLRSIAWITLGAAAGGCQRGLSDASGGMTDSAYVRALGALRRLYDDRMQSPVPAIPMPLGPNGTAPTLAQRRFRDSLQNARNDSVRVVDSLARLAVLTRLHVSEEALRAKARALALEPEKSQKVMEAVGAENLRLDSLARAAALKRPGDSAGTAAAKPAP